MDIEKLRTNFLIKLQPSGWDRVLKEFVDSERFDVLLTALFEKNNLEGITPGLSQIFNAFYECPYKNLSVVMVGQDPYPKPGVADGIAFSCSNTGKVQPSLRTMFREVEKLYPDGYIWDPDLRKWTRQGILMLNTAFTTKVGKIGQHYDIWKPFSEYLFNKLAEMNTGIIYIFMGNAAKGWANRVPESNYKLFCYHPAHASYTGGEWDCNDIFNRVNDILEAKNGFKITW